LVPHANQRESAQQESGELALLQKDIIIMDVDGSGELHLRATDDLETVAGVERRSTAACEGGIRRLTRGPSSWESRRRAC